MRNATYHPRHTRATLPAVRYCANGDARRAPFGSADKPLCGPCWDKVWEAADAARKA